MNLPLTKGQKWFRVVNVILLTLIACSCLLPLINVLAISFSSSSAVSSGKVTLWPVEFTTAAYEHIITQRGFVGALLNTLLRVALGVPINMFMIIFCAYPLSKTEANFPARKYYIWVFVITMLFNGGLIPWYLTVRMTGMINSIWGLVIPCAVPVYNVILMMNFFRAIPQELEEAAFIDGAGHLRTLLQIYLPNVLPSLATLLLFVTVYHWNEWFNGQILMSRTEQYPLQSYLRMILQSSIDYSNLSDSQIEQLMLINSRTNNAAQIFLGTLPILLVYPFVQRYFVAGMTMGAVKG